MTSQLPPSRVERNALVHDRKKDLPRPSPAPAPQGMGVSNDNALTLQRKQAERREKRITTIDKSLAKEAGRAKREFGITRR